ncbi:hypothetical protein VIOR3934_08396 [Vibrio orientalis CIP 102891 = ATCC 33934]|uniref:Uncharacterized protein n=1 Tax=Vibrio orientalis CIP 102891 = ATCC 33934 TaxID=675816 RepID=C9QFM0_VIBOR|nr:hypothetical protein [Vibrio orientalis]EEX94056.1 hypothetical protein VIA_001214 [Vibrio orientalis CIP 102891 = ATCC 33934]EGU52800.1 hypothetical protein VIOR3934_08396 [Vibrio orientalis CIP 102891 = ATCC 33934]
MQKIKVISLIALGAIIAIAASEFLKPELELDKQVFEIPISKTVSVEGFRNNSGGATVGFRYYYYVTDANQERQKPFLVTDSQKLDIKVNSDTSFSVSVDSNIYQFTNMVWVDDGEQLTALDISLEAHRP